MIPYLKYGTSDSIRTIEPRKDKWHVKPVVSDVKYPCEKVSVVRMSDNTSVFHAENVTSFPVRVDMSSFPSGIYRCDSFFNNKKHSRYFYYGDAENELSPTEKILLHLARNNSIFEATDFYTMLSRMLHDTVKTSSGAVEMIRGFVSSRDGTIQPYYIRIPEKFIDVTNVPVIVHLKIALPTSMEDWCNAMMQHSEIAEDSAIVIVPYARGARVYSGLAEGDVLDSLNDAREFTCADMNRVYLTGESLGGEGCWLIGGRYPDKFAAMMPRSSYPSHNWYNLLSLPLWHLQGEYDNPKKVEEVISILASKGADAHITIESGKLHTEHKAESIKEVTEWMLGKRRNTAPQKFIYTTYGDVDNAYWVKNIRPLRYGMKCYIEAEWCVTTSGAFITVIADNIHSFDIDLRDKVFAEHDEWTITVNKKETYSVKSKDIVEIRLSEKKRSSKRNKGNSGGIAQVFDKGFIIMYAKGNEHSNATKQSAYRLQSELMGRGLWQFDTYIDVVSDLDAGKAEDKNIILCVSTNNAGSYLSRYQNEMPFYFSNDVVCIDNYRYNQMACVMPRLDDEDTLLLVLADSMLPVLALQNIRKDVVLASDRSVYSGSFDADWGKIVWDAIGEGEYSHHTHDAQCEHCSHDEGESYDGEEGGYISTKESKIKRISRGVFVVIAVIAGGYFILFMRKDTKE